MNKIYVCIDLKTFFASVECVERKLDPFKTDLVVADATRGDGAICLAISPKMKQRGIKNRCRMWEIPKNVHPIIAKPRMKKYMEYSIYINSIYLDFVNKDDWFAYSIDECFIEATPYLNYYKKTPKEFAKMLIDAVYKKTGITAAAGIGTNLYLAKIALDITAKHSKDNIGYLDENLYKEQLWHHTPLTDFWQLGRGIENRLYNLHLKDMCDIANCDEKILYKEFGINAEFLIDHSKGLETCTIKEIKSYKPKSNSISNSHILDKDYNYIDARNILIEMVDNLILDLVNKNKHTTSVSVLIGYTKDKILPVKIDFLLDEFANCPPLREPSIETMISVSRSRGMRFHFFIQSLSQLDNLYGKEVSKIIQDNCGLIYLKTNNQETAETISKKLGKQTIESNSISHSANIKNNNQNMSTSLMGRDLMKADEVKQLHYKMIIFPVIGYPIIRDTYLYNKFKIYKKGSINRKINNIEDLTNTYFTIENIKHNHKENSILLRKNKLTEESKEMLEEKNQKQINLFIDIEILLEEVLVGIEYEVNYKENNELAYMEIILDKGFNKEVSIIKNKIDNERFHVNTEFNNNKNVIQVHFKSIFSLNKIYDKDIL